MLCSPDSSRVIRWASCRGLSLGCLPRRRPFARDLHPFLGPQPDQIRELRDHGQHVEHEPADGIVRVGSVNLNRPRGDGLFWPRFLTAVCGLLFVEFEAIAVSVDLAVERETVAGSRPACNAGGSGPVLDAVHSAEGSDHA